MQHTGICDCKFRKRRCDHVSLQEIKSWCIKVDKLLLPPMSRSKRRQVIQREFYFSWRQAEALERAWRGIGSTFEVIDAWCVRQISSDWELRGETFMSHIQDRYHTRQ